VTLAVEVAESEPYSEAEEAAFNVAGLARDAGDVRLLLGVLGLRPAARPWTVPRVIRRAIGCGRDGFAVSVMEHFLPRRARHLAPAALEAMLNAGIAAPDPLVPDRYQLTAAGRHLAIGIRGDPETAMRGLVDLHSREEFLVGI
jgi:hypothetical protein